MRCIFKHGRCSFLISLWGRNKQHELLRWTRPLTLRPLSRSPQSAGRSPPRWDPGLSAGETLPWEALQSAQLRSILCSSLLVPCASSPLNHLVDRMYFSSPPGETKNGCLWAEAQIHWLVRGSMPEFQVFFLLGYSKCCRRLSEALEGDVPVTDWTTF